MRYIDRALWALKFYFFKSMAVIYYHGGRAGDDNKQLVLVLDMAVRSREMLAYTRAQKVDSLNFKVNEVLELKSCHREVIGWDILESMELVFVAHINS